MRYTSIDIIEKLGAKETPISADKNRILFMSRYSLIDLNGEKGIGKTYTFKNGNTRTAIGVHYNYLHRHLAKRVDKSIKLSNSLGANLSYEYDKLFTEVVKSGATTKAENEVIFKQQDYDMRSSVLANFPCLFGLILMIIGWFVSKIQGPSFDLEMYTICSAILLVLTSGLCYINYLLVFKYEDQILLKKFIEIVSEENRLN